MFYESWAGKSGKKIPQVTGCLGHLFSTYDRSADLWYDANVKNQYGVEYDAHTARCTKDEITAHLANLALAGFVIEYGYESLPAQFPTQRLLTKPSEALMGHRFTIIAGTMSPTMRRFAFNGIRWVSENRQCRVAYAELLKHADKENQLECFNMFVIASLTDSRTGNHNVGAHYGFIKPFSEKQFKDLSNKNEIRNNMMSHIEGVLLRPKSRYDRGDKDLSYLAKPGGYKKYQEELAEAEQELVKRKKDEKSSLRTAMFA